MTIRERDDPRGTSVLIHPLQDACALAGQALGRERLVDFLEDDVAGVLNGRGESRRATHIQGRPAGAPDRSTSVRGRNRFR
jgi:hypothetical protein